MNKVIKILACASIALLFIAGVTVGVFLLAGKKGNDNNQTTNITGSNEQGLTDDVGAILDQSRLTKEEKTLTGVWESGDGWILGIRERAFSDKSFALDAIIYCPTYDKWMQITREDGSYISESDIGLELGDIKKIPLDDGDSVEAKEELIYNKNDDTITYSEYMEGKIIYLLTSGKVEEAKENMVFYRSDKKVTEIEDGWDWYYELEEARDPR